MTPFWRPVYAHRAQHGEAEKLYKRALAIREKVEGPEHASTAYTLGNLASMYREQREYARAEPLIKRSVQIIEKSLGPNHPALATSLDNYAAVLSGLNRGEEALKMFERADEIRKRAKSKQ